MKKLSESTLTGRRPPKERNAVLQRLLAERRKTPHASFLHSGIDDAEGELLDGLMTTFCVESVIEVGLANGYSTLFMLDILERSGKGRIVSLDPFQASDWNNAGLMHIAEAGLNHRHRHLAMKSWEAVAELQRLDPPFDLGFVDGSHDFDNFFVDMYIVEKFVKPGGIIVVDDVGWGSVRRALLYFMMNRDLEVIDLVSADQKRLTLAGTFKRALKRFARRIGRSDIHPGAAVQPFEIRFEGASMVALRKRGNRNDERSFVPF